MLFADSIAEEEHVMTTAKIFAIPVPVPALLLALVAVVAGTFPARAIAA